MGTGKNKRKRKIDGGRWRDRGEDGCRGCGEKRAWRNREIAKHIYCFVCLNVTSDGGEAGGEERGEVGVGDV